MITYLKTLIAAVLAFVLDLVPVSVERAVTQLERTVTKLKRADTQLAAKIDASYDRTSALYDSLDAETKARRALREQKDRAARVRGRVAELLK